MNDQLPSKQIDELRAPLFTYVVLGPLIAALFAEKIDNEVMVCLLFVGLIGGTAFWLRRRLDELANSCAQQQKQLEELKASPHLEEEDAEPVL